MDQRELKLEEMYVLIKDEKDVEKVCSELENVFSNVYFLRRHLKKNIGTSYYGAHVSGDLKDFVHADQQEYLDSVPKFEVSLEKFVEKVKSLKNEETKDGEVFENAWAVIDGTKEVYFSSNIENSYELVDNLVENELKVARKVSERYNTAHEFKGVIDEEIEEFFEDMEGAIVCLEDAWKAIKENKKEVYLEEIKQMSFAARKAILELIQVAAVCDKAWKGGFVNDR